MFSLFIVLSSFRESLAHDPTKCLFLNDKPCMARPIQYYPSKISLNKCTGSCNVLYPEICVPKERRDINLKAFYMITNKDEAKVMTEQLSCHCNCKFSNATCNSNQKWNNKTW